MESEATAVAVERETTLTRTRLLAAAWVVWLVGYSAARAWAVAPSLGPYGIDPWLFLALDVGSALPMAYGQVRLVAALRDRDPARVQRWVAIVSVAFLTPYAYLLLGAGKPLPDIAYVLIVAVVLVLGGATAWRIRHGARQVDADVEG